MQAKHLLSSTRIGISAVHPPIFLVKSTQPWPGTATVLPKHSKHFLPPNPNIPVSTQTPILPPSSQTVLLLLVLQSSDLAIVFAEGTTVKLLLQSIELPLSSQPPPQV